MRSNLLGVLHGEHCVVNSQIVHVAAEQPLPEISWQYPDDLVLEGRAHQRRLNHARQAEVRDDYLHVVAYSEELLCLPVTLYVFVS